MNWADYLRVLNFILFGLTIGEVGWILRQYFRLIKGTRRLLPFHVVTIGAGVIGLEVEAVIQNVGRFGEPLTWYGPVNFFLFALILAALNSMHRHLTRKVDVHKEIKPLMQDPREAP